MHRIRRKTDELKSRESKHPQDEEVSLPFTEKVPLATLTGTVLTALVQSSTAITVITVGLVNSGMLKLTQAVGIYTAQTLEPQ